jgi:ATP-dependent Clp protease ATP-binding subunit ClpC
LKRVLQRMIEDPMSEMILRGEVPNGSKVIIESNDKTAEDINEEESIVDIKVTQPKEIVKVESE